MKKKLFISSTLVLFFSASSGYAVSLDLLDWVSDPASKNSCSGYYRDPLWNSSGSTSLSQEGSVDIVAEKSQLQETGHSLLIGKVMITQLNRSVQADRAYLYRDSKNDQGTVLDLIGNVIVREPGQLFISKMVHLLLQSRAGDFNDVLYRVLLNTQNSGLANIAYIGAKGEVIGLSAHGTAKQIHQDKPGHLILQQATYTTCSPIDPIWQVTAKQIELNREIGRGTARGVTLKIKTIPILYTPYFNFPLDKRRQTGFLFSTVGSSSTGGFMMNLPYYWNIAPNYDMTITPTFYEKRGVLFKGLFRYLTKRNLGNLSGAFIPHDNGFSSFQRNAFFKFSGDPALSRLLTAKTDRYYYAWQHDLHFNPHWSAAVNYTAASDDYYFQDFGEMSSIMTSNQLLQQAKISYVDEHWAVQGLAQRYETLHPVNLSPISNQYSRLPETSVVGSYPNQWLGLNYQFSGNYTHFIRNLNPGETSYPPMGERLNLQPGISLPLNWMAGYVTPAVEMQMTSYALTSQLPSYPINITRTLPILSLDSGLFFDRNIHIAGGGYQQTLEPRLFYLYVPYRPQAQIPIFDTGLQPFNYDQLFQANRFVGLDRIGDTNQVSMALTTRFLDDILGQEKLRLSIGQIYYFKKRQVMFCNTFNCDDMTSSAVPLVGISSSTTKMSPFVSRLSYHFNPQWSFSGDLAWDSHIHGTEYGNVGFQYKPASNHIVNLGYNFIRYGDVVEGTASTDGRNNFNQTNASIVWPLSAHWQGIANWNYNVSHGHSQTYFAGLEYDSCCLGARVVMARTFDSIDAAGDPVFNKAVYLQLLLKGFGNLGTSDPAELLAKAIPGYKDDFSNT